MTVIVTVAFTAVLLYNFADITSPVHLVQTRRYMPPKTDDDHYDSVEHGFVVAMRYSGQQGTGIQALMSLQCFAGTLNLSMYILEPTMNETSFGSFLELNSNKSLLKFSDMFDIAHFNNASRNMGFTELSSETEFYSIAPKIIILVESYLTGTQPITLVWTSNKKNECYTTDQPLRGFCVVRVVSVSGKKDMLSSYQIFTKQELFQVVFGPWLPKDVTLIFRQWHTPWYVSNPSLENPFKCQDIRSVTTETQFHTSPKLLNDAQRYEALVLGSKNRLAIMFRLERMVIYLNTMKKRNILDNVDVYVSKCLCKVTHIAEDIWKKVEDIHYV